MDATRSLISRFANAGTFFLISFFVVLVALPLQAQTFSGPGRTQAPEIEAPDSGLETDENENQSAGTGSGPVVGRWVFYNNSGFDSNDDVDAIDDSKVALLEGQTASFANYTSYIRGINGIILDVENLANAPGVNDFEFKTGADDSPDQWDVLTTAPTIVFQAGAGSGGSDRIKLIWPDETITRTWLQVRLIANGNTGLSVDDVFYFGNVAGETGNDPNNAVVNLADVAEVRQNQTGFGTAAVDNRYDLNRDGFVRLDDVALARSNQTGFTPLPLIKPLSGKAIDSGLGTGVNFGNMLEAPFEGAWGLTVEELYFDKVVEAGLEHIRLPISWTHHADTNAPYTIDATFFERIDWCVEQAKQRGLKIIINDHHHEELDEDPSLEWNRALAIWTQVATRYQNEPETVYFEILNEPHGQFTASPATWDLYVLDVLAIIRATNPTRKVLVGPVNFNSIDALASFVPPPDANLIGTVHYYEPFAFTHQGAEWVDPSPPIGVTWEGNRIGFSSSWQSWSWGTTFVPTEDGLEVTYDQGWAGMRFHRNESADNTNELHLVVDGTASLQIWFVDENDEESEARAILQTTAGENSYVVDLAALGDSSEIKDVVIQNFSADPLATITFKQLRMCGVNSQYALIESELATLRNAFKVAGKWSQEHNIPMHTGEFGAYRFGDIDSRVRWTVAVRQACDDYEIDWAYWEFGAGFGFYNPDDGSWRLPLLQALVPDFGG